MTAREIGRALAYYAVVGTVAACLATVAAVPFEGPVGVAVTVVTVLTAGWLTTVVLDAVTARAKGGRS
ncbi:hypothetical protein AB0N17_03360 [Streptomyces sp. NPDC051133]|uniref:hypothetical protein n=1 Tax=Streptomyces sp. NPDC051133 TaxID=3155521 RepID=UPI00342AB8CD